MRHGNDKRGCFIAFCTIVGVGLAIATPATGSDGVIEINQARALAGGVTPGDSPGFPVTISQPGSYRLTGNLDVTVAADPKNTDAIDVTADNVTIDLNGFSILGPAVCSGRPVTSCTNTGSGAGVYGAAGLGGYLVVRNGTIQGMGGSGVYTYLPYVAIERVLTVSCGSGGILISNGTVSKCQAANNGGDGISDSGPGVVSESMALYNQGAGISVEETVVSGNTAHSNGGVGILVTLLGTASNNTMYNNAGVGLQCIGGGSLSNSFYNNNGGGAQSTGCVILGPNDCGTSLCP